MAKTIRVTYPQEWFDNVISKGKLILEELAKDTFRRYREVGKLVLESGYRKGQWHSEHREKAIKEWNISQRTFSNIVQLGEMSDQEFSNAIANFSSVYAWANQSSQEQKTKEIVDEMVKEMVPAIEEAFSNTKPYNKYDPERNKLVLNMLLKNLKQGLLFCPVCGERMLECSHCHSSLQKMKEEKKL